MVVGAVVAALVLGYVAGLLSFKVKSRWCPQCGSWTHRTQLRRSRVGVR